MTSATIMHFQRRDQVRQNSRTITFPESPLGITAPLNSFLNYVYLLGDPHLGKKFTAGVPLHRRGDRERMQWQLFHDEVVSIKKGRYYHVTMGDLFDGWDVNNESIHFAAETYRLASVRNPDVEYIILAGNHDLSKDRTRVSAFHLFEEMIRDLPNVCVVMDNIEERTIDDLTFLFVPYHPFETSVEYLTRQEPKCISRKRPFVAFGHWDVEDYGRDTSDTLGLVPWELFTPDVCKGVITGHDHNRSRQVHESGIEVFITGSMQAYAHGQDDVDDPDPLYLTLTLDNALEQLAEDENVFAQKCLRIILAEGQEPVADINCFQLQFTRQNQVSQSGELVLDVDVQAFDLESLFKATMADHGVSNELSETLWNKL